MSNLLIKGPQGQVIAAPRGWTTATVVDDEPVISINLAALRPGWTVVTDEPPAAAPVSPPAPVVDDIAPTITIEHDGAPVEGH